MIDGWRSALAGLVVRHPDPTRTVVLSLDDGPLRLMFHVLRTPDTTRPDVIVDDFPVSTVLLECWPGITLARAWIAAAWAAYVIHEALELVTLTDLKTRPLDPHAPPFSHCWVRTGLPARLTMQTLEHALSVVMTPLAARSFVEAGQSAAQRPHEPLFA